MNQLFRQLLSQILFIYCIIQLSACSIAQLTVKASMPMVEGGMTALNRETDLVLAEAAMPSNIELMEGMIINAPDNEALRNYAAQAYYGYAYGFVEDANPARAAKLYRRGLNHALYNLEKSDLSKKIIFGRLDILQTKLDSLDKDDITALFWAASNWAKWIDHNRNKPEAIADLPRAVMLMQRVMDLDENYFMAGPHLFFGVYYGSRSPMLGGNVELAESHFEKARLYNNNKLFIVDLLQAQFLDRQKLDQKKFHQRLTRIINSQPEANSDTALLNSIAKQKAELMLSKESKWF